MPIEEILHTLMRPFTEKAMLAELVQSGPTRIDQVRRIVDDWIAVEEAIVGGVVWRVLPEVCARYVSEEEPGSLSNALVEREEHPQYRLLRNAIQVVADMGVNEALAIYRESPLHFKNLISSPVSSPTLQPVLGLHHLVAG